MENIDQKQLKPKILIICDYYLPGYKSGGGMRTIVNMVESLNYYYDFWIITRDHDGKLDCESYKNIKINEWNKIQEAKVFYLSKDMVKMSKLHELIKHTEPDILFFNSYFSTLTIYTLILHRLKFIKLLNKVVAPCGELSEGGLSLKNTKKKVFLFFANIFGIYRKVIWKASSVLEEAEIHKISGQDSKVFIAPDILPKQILPNFDQSLKPQKKIGMARLVFLSRFMRKKNFKFLLEVLTEIKGDLLIDVWGPLEDLSYWEECLELIKTLPSNIKVETKGAIPFEAVATKLFEYHFFVLPTLGENFGHVFIEALSAGCPLLISDRTPWVNLAEKEIGWDIALENPTQWRHCINNIIALDDDSYSHLSNKSRKFAIKLLSSDSFVQKTRDIIDFALKLN